MLLSDQNQMWPLKKKSKSVLVSDYNKLVVLEMRVFYKSYVMFIGSGRNVSCNCVQS